MSTIGLRNNRQEILPVLPEAKVTTARGYITEQHAPSTRRAYQSDFESLPHGAQVHRGA